MRIQASAGRDRKKDLRDHCQKLTLTAQTDAEAYLLSVLYRRAMKDSLKIVFVDDEWRRYVEIKKSEEQP